MDDPMEYNLTSSKPQAEIIQSRLLGRAKIFLARLPRGSPRVHGLSIK